jgi:hypothetical protein
MLMKNPNVSYRYLDSAGRSVLDLVSQISTSAQMLSSLSTNPRAWRLLHSRQPAITQSLWVQEVIFMTLAPTVPVPQPQLSSTKATQG